MNLLTWQRSQDVLFSVDLLAPLIGNSFGNARAALVIFTAGLVFVTETQLVSIDNVLFGGFSVNANFPEFYNSNKTADIFSGSVKYFV